MSKELEPAALEGVVIDPVKTYADVIIHWWAPDTDNVVHTKKLGDLHEDA